MGFLLQLTIRRNVQLFGSGRSSQVLNDFSLCRAKDFNAMISPSPSCPPKNRAFYRCDSGITVFGRSCGAFVYTRSCGIVCDPRIPVQSPAEKSQKSPSAAIRGKRDFWAMPAIAFNLPLVCDSLRELYIVVAEPRTTGYGHFDSQLCTFDR